jgi:hypothetical protein
LVFVELVKFVALNVALLRQARLHDVSSLLPLGTRKFLAMACALPLREES